MKKDIEAKRSSHIANGQSVADGVRRRVKLGLLRFDIRRSQSGIRTLGVLYSGCGRTLGVLCGGGGVGRRVTLGCADS